MTKIRFGLDGSGLILSGPVQLGWVWSGPVGPTFSRAHLLTRALTIWQVKIDLLAANWFVSCLFHSRRRFVSVQITARGHSKQISTFSSPATNYTVHYAHWSTINVLIWKFSKFKKVRILKRPLVFHNFYRKNPTKLFYSGFLFCWHSFILAHMLSLVFVIQTFYLYETICLRFFLSQPPSFWKYFSKKKA